MNSTLEKLVGALVDVPESLRGVLADWDNLDDDLQEHYARDTKWLLRSVRREVLAQREDPDCVQNLRRVEDAANALASLSDSIQLAMGFRPESILPPGITRGRQFGSASCASAISVQGQRGVEPSVWWTLFVSAIEVGLKLNVGVTGSVGTSNVLPASSTHSRMGCTSLGTQRMRLRNTAPASPPLRNAA